MNARTAIARPAEMSSCATSAAHDRMKAAPTIASPNSSASTAFARDASENRSTIAGIVRATAMSSEVRRASGRCVAVEMSDGLRPRSEPTALPLGRRSRPRRGEGSTGPRRATVMTADPLVDYSPSPTEGNSPSRRRPVAGGVTRCSPDGVGAARLVVARDPRRRRAVHQRGRVDRGGLRPVRGRGRQRAGRGRHRAPRDDPAARGDRVRSRERRGDRHRRDPGSAVHADDARDVRRRHGGARVRARRAAIDRPGRGPGGPATGPRVLPVHVRAGGRRRPRARPSAALGPRARAGGRLRLLRPAPPAGARGARARGRGAQRDPPALSLGLVPPGAAVARPRGRARRRTGRCSSRRVSRSC